MPTYREKKERLRQLVKQQQQERIRQIQEQGYNFNHTDAFRVAEKHYKYYVHRQTDYSKVIQPQLLKSRIIDGHVVYQLEEPKGAFLVKNFTSVAEQYQIGFQALNDFVYKPYRTNLDGTNGLYFDNEVKQQKKQEQNQETEEITTEAKVEQEIQENKQYFFNQKIRMANLGYQYDWPHRSYPKTKVPIPTSVTKLTQKAKSLYQKISEKQQVQYHGEAVIVNFYKVRDYMIGHLDDGEQDQSNPIFSYCFGLSCIFLMGFPDKMKEPVAIRLQAGDMLIMSGFSRICYHGVPRIIQNSYQPPQQNQELINTITHIDQQKNEQLRINGFNQIQNYFKTHRLNVNVRQVWVHKQQKMEQLQQIKNQECQQTHAE